MYQFSRSIYRELAPLIRGDEIDQARSRAHLLEASEATVRRLATDRRHFARPAATLFGEVRDHFPLAEQVRVYTVIDHYLGVATEFLDSLPQDLQIDGRPRQCQASTRKGTPCRREPRPGRDYCPSHRHLEEPLGDFEGILEAPQARS